MLGGWIPAPLIYNTHVSVQRHQHPHKHPSFPLPRSGSLAPDYLALLSRSLVAAIMCFLAACCAGVCVSLPRPDVLLLASEEMLQWVLGVNAGLLALVQVVN